MEAAHNGTQNDKEVIKMQFWFTYTILSLEDRKKKTYLDHAEIYSILNLLV